MKKSVKGLLHCCNYIYFNEDFPENQNIRCANKKDPWVHVYDGNNTWLPEIKESAMKQVVTTIESIFISFFDDIKKHITDDYKAIKQVRRFCKEVACSFDWDIDTFEDIFNVTQIEPSDGEEVEKRTRKLHELIIEHIHLQSCKQMQTHKIINSYH